MALSNGEALDNGRFIGVGKTTWLSRIKTWSFSALKNGSVFMLSHLGLHWCLREWLHKDHVTILVYHKPDPILFEENLAYLAKRYHFVTLETVVAAIRNHDFSTLPSKSLVVTIDDGYMENFLLLESCKRYGLKPTIYCCSDIIDTYRHYWQLDSDAHPKNYAGESDADSGMLSKSSPFDPKQVFDQRQALNHDEMEAMQPWIDFQSHGRFHFNLPVCNDDTAYAEIGDSRKILSATLGYDCEHFAYPFGDYTERDESFVKCAGYRSCRTTEPGWNTANSDPFRLKIAAMVPDNASVNMLKAQLTGLPIFFDFIFNQLGVAKPQ